MYLRVLVASVMFCLPNCILFLFGVLVSLDH